MKDVSVIIINYNTSKLTIECIESIRKYTQGISYEIVVVDNDSQHDDQRHLLKQDKDIIYIQSKENLGFGRANNLGLLKAEGEYILFLNSDTLLKNNALKIMVDFARAYEGNLGGLGAILTNRVGERIHSYGSLLKMSNDWNDLVLNPLKKALHLYKEPIIQWPSKYMKVGYVTGADLLVKRCVLDTCGGFSPSFFMYCEETEMQHRFKDNGYDNILMNGPEIIHLEGECSKRAGMSLFLRSTLRQQRSQYIYFKLTEPRWKYYVYRIIHPLLRQTMWLNPHASFKDKWRLMKVLFCKVKLIKSEDYNEYIG